jgi:hypothetical protein
LMMSPPDINLHESRTSTGQLLLLGIVWLDSASEAYRTDQSSGDQKISQRLGHPS